MNQVNTEPNDTGDRGWRAFPLALRNEIDHTLQTDGGEPSCPECGRALARRRGTRLRAIRNLPAGCYDLECRACHRFHPVVPCAPETQYFVGIHRLAFAVMHVGTA